MVLPRVKLLKYKIECRVFIKVKSLKPEMRSINLNIISSTTVDTKSIERTIKKNLFRVAGKERGGKLVSFIMLCKSVVRLSNKFF